MLSVWRTASAVDLFALASLQFDAVLTVHRVNEKRRIATQRQRYLFDNFVSQAMTNKLRKLCWMLYLAYPAFARVHAQRMVGLLDRTACVGCLQDSPDFLRW